MRLMGWLAWGLCGALVRGDTYLSANESWVLSYDLSKNLNCSKVDHNMLHPNNFNDSMEAVRALMKYHPACEIYAKVNADSKSRHLGIIADGTRTPGTAVGLKTAADIFGISTGSFWCMLVEIENNNGAVFGKRFVIRAGLDETETTMEQPADSRSYIVPEFTEIHMDWNEPTCTSLPKIIRGPFQVLSIGDSCLQPPFCDVEIRRTQLKFETVIKDDTVIKDETTFETASGDWNASYEIIPLCDLYRIERLACKKVYRYTDVGGCIGKMPDCALEVIATLKQAKAYDGLVYDSENSTTPGTRIGLYTYLHRLPGLGIQDSWRLMEVAFEGRDYSDELQSGECLRGIRLGAALLDSYNYTTLGASPPTNTNPLDFHGWYMDGFRFVEGAPGLFRNVIEQDIHNPLDISVVNQLMQMDNQFDINLAVQQKQDRRCHWRQTGCTVKLSSPAGEKKKTNYLKEKNNWISSGYFLTGFTTNYCGGEWPKACSDLAPEASLRACVDELVKSDPTCTFDIRLELYQQIGFDGMVVGEDGNSAPIIAIGKNITSKFFTSPLKKYPIVYLRDVTFDVDIKGIGTQENACDAEGSKARMVYRNFLDADLPTPQNPANFSDNTWHKYDAPIMSNLVQQHVEVALDPKADFSLSAHLVPGQGCVTRQQGASLVLVIPVSPLSR